MSFHQRPCVRLGGHRNGERLPPGHSCCDLIRLLLGSAFSEYDFGASNSNFRYIRTLRGYVLWAIIPTCVLGLREFRGSDFGTSLEAHTLPLF